MSTSRLRIVLALSAVLSALVSLSSAAQPMKLPSQVSVSNSGGLSYSVPIQVAPGTAGMQPNLSLEYSSQSGNGIMGLGWYLSGLPTIERCARTMAQDGIKGSVNFDANDRFCLGGQRLVAIDGTYGADETEYRTEVESFSKIVSYGTYGTGPQWFKVWTKSGEIMEFGNTEDSKLESQGSFAVRAWHLNKLSDTSGNSMSVTYNVGVYEDPYEIEEPVYLGFIYPHRIDYTYNTGLSAYNSVRFEYDPRTDVIPEYVAGEMTKTTHRLTHVKSYEGNDLVFDYQISYSPGTNLNPSLITSIQLCDGSTSQVCLPATSFTWPAHNTPVNLATNATSYDFNSGVQPGVSIGDYNGDGLPDFLRDISLDLFSDEAKVNYWMSTAPNSWESATKDIADYAWPTGSPGGSYVPFFSLHPLPADLNADGFTDAIIDDRGHYYDVGGSGPEYPFGPVRHSINLNDTTGALEEEVFGNGGANSLAVPYGDLDGDGRDDQLYLQASPNGAIPYYSDGDGTFTAGSAISGLYASAALFRGDFNGDGCMDILSQGTDNKIHFSCNATASSVTVPNWAGSGYTLVPGDFNGDGNTDLLLVHSTSDTELMLSNGLELVSTGNYAPVERRPKLTHIRG